MRYYAETKCFLSYERSFFRPVFRWTLLLKLSI